MKAVEEKHAAEVCAGIVNLIDCMVSALTYCEHFLQLKKKDDKLQRVVGVLCYQR